MLGLRFCVTDFSSCGKRGPLFIAVLGPLIITASLVAEHRLQTRRLSNCGSRAQLLRGMWDLPRPGLEPVSPALAGGLSTSAPPGKPHIYVFNALFVTTLPTSVIWCFLLKFPEVKGSVGLNPPLVPLLLAYWLSWYHYLCSAYTSLCALRLLHRSFAIHPDLNKVLKEWLTFFSRDFFLVNN